MDGYVRLRERRSAAQRYAVSQLEREIEAADPYGSRKYIREFTEAFQSYRAPLGDSELARELERADVLLVADYHALPASQLYAARLVERFAAAARPTLLALEAVFVRDQHLLDQWQAGELGDARLREAIRFDLEWGFDWEPFLALLHAARTARVRIYGSDCVPRGDLRRIALRDERAAERVAEIAAREPGARMIVLYGESHMAPQHLPAAIRRRLPGTRLLTVLQNVDPLYWAAAGEPGGQVGAVRVRQDVVCVFNVTPLEKYESYRQCLERWRHGAGETSTVDLTPSFWNVISALLRFLGAGEGDVPAELLPRVSLTSSAGRLLPALRRRINEARARELVAEIEREGSAYCPETNRIYAERFELSGAAAAAARFVHAACSGLLGPHPGLGHASVGTPQLRGFSVEDRFYSLCFREALADFGARIMDGGRKLVGQEELLASLTEADGFSGSDLRRMIEFVSLHRHFESHPQLYRETPSLIREGRAYSGAKLRCVAALLGQLLGARFYHAYLRGTVRRRDLRSLYGCRLGKPGQSKLLYFQLARRAGVSSGGAKERNTGRRMVQ